MDCPICGLANVETAERCDCGYDFRTRTGGGPSVRRGDWLDRHNKTIVGLALLAFCSVLGLVGGVLVSLLVGVGLALARGSRKRIASDEGGIRRDSRQQIMYLRPFELDQALSGVRANYLASRFGFIPNVRLERLAREIEKVGPFICVGKPGEPFPQGGPQTVYVEDAEWEGRVKAEIKRSRFVILRYGFNWNTVRELHWATAYLGPTRVLFWFPGARDVDYEDFRTSATDYLQCKNLPSASRVLFAYFDAAGSASLVCLGFRDRVWGLGWSVWRSLAPFLTQTGVDESLRARYARRVGTWRIVLVVGALCLALIYLW